ncbi:OmpA family protein [Altererythrobacter sp. CC-YST694]|uniref:OmpA family protein n=1 Tax=Altererythrobacter sp. CC-YST694 TaxID=2755038 RepID=UPI001D01C44A|nr:OmpA family protein [Altererythrobacter sp. CC-YST694]MCB5423882.1 OmpA family protein [Altererythrobacter sp. CC-YST694]
MALSERVAKKLGSGGIAMVMLLLAACQTVPDNSSPYSPAQIAALRQYQFEQEGDRWLLDLDSKLLFPTDSAALVDGQVVTIGTMARELAKVGIGGADVEGHADSVGDAEYNRDLSLRRAQSVKDVLTGGGMAADRVAAAGLGESQPIASNDTEEGRAQNRRVVIIVSPDDVIPAE